MQIGVLLPGKSKPGDGFHGTSAKTFEELYEIGSRKRETIRWQGID